MQKKRGVILLFPLQGSRWQILKVLADSIRLGEREMSVTVPFSLRVRLGRCEVEISGNRDEVLRTIEDLPSLVALISEAFSHVGGKESQNGILAPSISSVSQSQTSSPTPVYPSIQSTGGCADGVLMLLATDWGRTAPRTLPEIVEAMRVNAVHFPATTLSGVLNWLVRKGRVKRWKTDKGYVYVLAQVSAMPSQPSMQTEATATASNEG